MQPEPVLTGGEIVAAADRCMFAYTTGLLMYCNWCQNKRSEIF